MTEGIRTALLFNWSLKIEHENKTEEQEKRYFIGQRRALFLKNNAQPFAIKFDNQQNEQHCAFLVELEDDDLNDDMPSSTQFEYICGKRTQDNRYIIFSYIWFESLDNAKSYVKNKGMNILGGW